MSCKYTFHSPEGTSYCMLAESSAKKLIEIEKMIEKWIPILEKKSTDSAIFYNILEDFKQIKKSI